jgi:hypothetical protein
MAKAYLGKISALVTANTSDFNSKLNASAKEVRSFASSMQSTLSRAQTSATASLRGIYTESQKVSRALQAVATQRLSFKGFDAAAVGSIREAVDQFRALQAASVAVNEPLSNAARTVERLSASVQQSFDPALKSAQKSAEYLDAALKRGGIVGEQSFERIRQRAIAAAEAADRLAEASQLASVGPRGRELAFAAPRVRDALSASADVRQRAANAPAVALEGGRVSSDVQKLVALDNLIQKRRAEIESGTILNIDTTQARASLENLLAVAKRVRDQVNSAIGGGPDAETATLINRARGQREFYEESERLAKQAATDEAALIARRTNAQRESSEERTRLERQAAADEVALIARRTNAQREGYEERTRLERQAAEDAATLLIRQARAQQEFEEERRRRDAVAASDAANEVAPAINRSRVQRESAIDFGLDLDAPQRQIEVLRGSIVSLKGQIDTLPAGVRSQFIPAIIAAQQNLERLSSLPAATTAELSQAAREVDRLSKALGRARQAANIPSFRQFAQELSTRQAVGELQALQQILARIGAEAAGPAAQAYNKYAAAVRRAAREGTTELPATRRELERLQVAAAQAAAATRRISFPRALREIRRGGDIARGGVDNFSLALNQAAFAIDDFFSATGGLEQKLRAVSNNVTQLAFIVGGTEGLFIGLAAVIGGQALLALTKWANGGRSAEDQTKALNNALARQKSIVEELAQSFRNLGSSIADKAFAESTKSAREFEERLKEVVKQLREVRNAQLGDINPDVQRERAQQNALEKRLEGEQNIGRRVAIQNEINAARQREQEAAARAAAIGAPDQRDIRGALRRTVFVSGTRGPSPANRRQFAQIDADLAAAGNNREELLKILRRAQQEQGVLAQEGEFRQARSRPAQENVRVLQEVIARLENAGDIVRVVEQGFRLAEQASNTLAQAQQKAADALEAGAPGAEDAFASLEQLAGGLRASLDAISKAQEDFSKRTILAEERDNIIRRAVEAINAGGQGRQQAADRADALDRERRVSPERLFEARLNRSRDTLRESGFGQGLLGRQLAGLEISRQQALSRISQNPNDKAARQQLEAINKQIVAIESASLALSRFGESLNRAAQEAESNLGAARQAANEARQEVLLRDTPRNRERLDQANLDLAAQEQAKVRVDAEVQAARIRIEAEAQAGGLLRNEFLRIRDIQEQIAAGSQDQNIIRELSSLLQGVNRQVQEDPRVRAAADASSQTEQDRQARLRGIRLGMTPGQQLGNELQEGLDEIQRAFGDQLKEAARLREEGESMADTGRRLAAGDEQMKKGRFPADGDFSQRRLFALERELRTAQPRNRKEIEDNIAKTEQELQAFRDFAAQAGERLAEADKLDVAKQFKDERLRQAAPQVFALQDAVQNAILQGPSRAALNAADVTTMEGSRELNRLLRGDDPARDVNLLELQKQTALLEEANRIAKDGPRVAN